MAAGLRVALIVGRLGGDGGTEGQAWHCATGLAARGHDVVVYAQSGAQPPGASLRAVLPAGRGVLGVIRLVRAVGRLRLDGYDVAQSFVRVPGATIHRAGGGAHAAWMRARGGLPRPLDLATLAAERRAMRDARIVLCNSEMAARDVREAHGLGADRVRVVRNGVDLARFRPDAARRAAARAVWGVPDGGRVALFAGHGFRRKGLDVAALAFRRAAGARDRLVVLGRDAHARARLAAIRRDLGERLIVLGPRADPESWMPGADAVILPTRYDPAANTTLEALACGVPAITSGRDGAAEIVPDPHLVVADPRDVSGFTDALGHAWGSGSSDAWRAAAEAWPGSRMTAQLETIYRELVYG